MIRRIIVLCLLMILVFVPFAFADTARMGSFASGLEGVMGVGDVSSGTTIEVTEVGSLAITAKSRAIGTTFASGTSSDKLIYTGACNIQSISVSGVSAGDWAMVYDGTTAAGTPRFDPRISANTSSTYLDTKGAPFTTGIYVAILDWDVFATVVYDY